MAKGARYLARATTAVVACALLATLAWAFATTSARPLDGVEGDVLFEADRIRAGLALYTDPATGVLDYGPPPARYLVLYPPLWSAMLSLVPRAFAPAFGRLAASAAWFGGLAFLAWRAEPRRRAAVWSVAAFVAGIWVLALYGANARPDAVAVLASAVALERAARLSAARGAARVDALSGVLFALAVWIKPNVLGAAPGVFLACLLATRGSIGARARSVLPGLAGLLLTSVAIALVLHVVSHGAWLRHLLASTGQPPDGRLWLRQMGDRGPFFVAPLVATLAVGLRARREPGAAMATGALATSLLWALVSLAKIGSASNYFMEPCLAMLVVLSRADLPDASPRTRGAAALLAFVQVVWNGTGSVLGATRAVPAAFERAGALADVRRVCRATPEGVILADEPGLELALNGRVVATPFQTTHLARSGRFPIDAWLADVASPRTECLVMQDDLLERPEGQVSVAHDRFGPEMRRALTRRFELVTKRAGFWIYRAARVPE